MEEEIIVDDSLIEESEPSESIGKQKKPRKKLTRKKKIMMGIAIPLAFFILVGAGLGGLFGWLACSNRVIPNEVRNISVGFVGEEDGALSFEWTPHGAGAISVYPRSEQEIRPGLTADIIVEYQHAGSNEWTEEIPLAVGEHKIRGTVSGGDDSYYRGSRTIPYIITHNTSFTISASRNGVYTTTTIANLVAERYFYRDNIAACENEILESILVNDTKSFSADNLSEVVPGEYRLELSLTTSTHKASLTGDDAPTITVLPSTEGMNDMHAPWFSRFNHVYNGAEQAISVSIPERPYFEIRNGEVRHIVRYTNENGSTSEDPPIEVGTYQVEVEIFVLNAPNLIIDRISPTESLQMVINRRPVSFTGAIDKSFMHTGEEIDFFASTDDMTDFVIFSAAQDTSILPSVSDFYIEVIKNVEGYPYGKLVKRYVGGVLVEGSSPTEVGEYTVHFSLRGGTNFTSTGDGVVATYSIVLEKLYNSISWSDNLHMQVYDAVEPIYVKFSVEHEVYSFTIEGTANDGTTFFSDDYSTSAVEVVANGDVTKLTRVMPAMMPSLAGEYSATLVVYTNGIRQTSTEYFTINRRQIRWEARNNRFFYDNVPFDDVDFHFVVEYESKERIDDSLFTVDFLLGANTEPLTQVGNHTAIYSLSTEKAHNFELAVPVTAQFSSLERSSPYLISGAVVEYSGRVEEFLEFGGIPYYLGNKEAVMFSIDGGDVDGIPTDAGEYMVTVIVRYFDGEARRYEFPYTILRRELSVEVNYSEFTEGDDIDFGLGFVQGGALPSLGEINISHRSLLGGQDFVSGVPSEVGVFFVRFLIEQRNFFLDQTAAVTIYAYGAPRITWNAHLVQTFGETVPLIVNLRDYQQFVSIEIEGQTVGGIDFFGTSYQNDGSVMPLDAGTYQITLTFLQYDNASSSMMRLPSYTTITVVTALTIQQRPVVLHAQSQEFEIGDTIEHILSADGVDEIPPFSVVFTNLLTGETGLLLSDISTDEQGAFEALFTITNPNFLQTNVTTAIYRIVSEGRLRISELVVSLESLETEFVNIAAPDSPIPIGKEQPVTVTGIAGLDSFQLVQIYYRRIYAYQGALHAQNTGIYQEGALVAVDEAATTAAPTLAGIYEVTVAITDILADEQVDFVFRYHIKRQAVNITITRETSLSSTTAAIRVAGNLGQGHNEAARVNLDFTLDDPWLNHAEGFTQARRRAAISMIRIESVALANGTSIQPIEIRSSRPLTDAAQSGIGANNFYAATNALAQIPANALAGTYRVTYLIDQPNFVAQHTEIFTLSARTEVDWRGLNQEIGQNAAVEPILRPWQQHSAPIYFEGIDGTDFARSTTMPLQRGTYSVSTVGISDGQQQSWTATLRIVGQMITINPDNRTMPFHNLNGEPIPINLNNIGVPLQWQPLLSVADFSIVFREFIDGVPSLVGTAEVPSLPGRFLVEFSLANNPNFSSNTATAIYEITARTGQLRFPPHSSWQAGQTGDLGIQFLDFHENRVIEFEGIDGTSFARSQAVPTGIGSYRVFISATTDTVVESFTKTLSISLTVQNMLPSTLIFSPQGTSTAFLPLTEIAGFATQNNWLEYTFTNAVHNSKEVLRLDGSSVPDRISLMPGITEVSVTGQGLTPIITQGSIRVLFNNTEDAFRFGENYFNNYADSWFTIYSGWTQATVTTRTYTWRYRNDSRDEANEFFFQTVNAGNDAPAGAGRTRMGLRSSRAFGSGTWVTRFSNNSTSPNSSIFSTSNPLLNWHRFNDITPVNRDREDYRSFFGFTPDGLTGYTVNAGTVTNDFRRNLNLGAGDQYSFTFTFNSGAIDRTRIQIARFSDQTFGGLSSLRISFTIDLHGRVIQIDTVDAYEISIPIIGGQLATHTGTELIFYNNINYPSVPIWRDPRSGHTGTQTADITFF